MTDSIAQHNLEIQQNLQSWQNKPLLRRIYREFHELIAAQTARRVAGISVELGSGIGNIKDVIPGCLRTDIFSNPWIDQIESAYQMSFESESIANLILFDVFHHLRYPGTALQECRRVLKPGGRIIIFDPCMSLTGLLVYGLFHHEPIALNKKIEWTAPENWSSENDTYYAAQGNVFRIFFGHKPYQQFEGLKVVHLSRYSCLSYVASGGYGKPQLYPDRLLPIMRFIDFLCQPFPLLFATRALVVLEKV